MRDQIAPRVTAAYSCNNAHQVHLHDALSQDHSGNGNHVHSMRLHSARLYGQIGKALLYFAVNSFVDFMLLSAEPFC